MRVASNGGQPEVVISTKPDEAVTNLGAPQLLPGGDAVLFTVQPQGVIDGDKLQTVVQSLKSGQRRVVIQAGSDVRYVPTGHLAYVFGGTLVAVPFDVKRLEVTGSAVPIVEGVRKRAFTTEFGFSKGGTLIYLPGPVRPGSPGGLTLAFLDREGKKAEPLKMPAGSYNYPRISPNGKRVAFVSDDGKEAGIWIYDMSGASSPRKLTFGGGNRYPVWSGDSQRLAFQSDREGDLGIWQQRADGSDAAERLTKPDKGVEHIPDSWSLDGQWLSFTSIKDSHQDVWVYSIRDKKALPFAQVPMQTAGRSAFSPDGKWLAYQRRDNNNSIIVQPFPANATQYQISDCGSALDPLWSPDGKELFCQPRGGIVSVTVNTHPIFTFGNAKTIDGVGYLRLGPESPRNWDIMPDGKQFIVVAPGDQPETASSNQINIVLNWFTELQQRVPVK
jgi:serine/threonine-protein kinase